MNTYEQDLKLSIDIAHAVHKNGGRAMYVGGMIRDEFLGLTSKDIDLEIYGITPDTLKCILSKFGKIQQKGTSFGVYGIEHSNIDIAMPRREHKIGTKHTDFDVSIDPFMSFHDATIRRDLTINAMMKDVITGEIIDLWNGQDDLRNKTIKHINTATFAEDPLRVFRVAQFSARFDAKIAEETLQLCRNIDVTTVTKERIFEELSKALLKSERPSIFFTSLRQMDHLKEFFPELQACINTPQNPKYHPEGNVFEHTMLVLDYASQLKNQAKEPLFFMLSALFHDIGKPIATTTKDDGTIISYEHDTEGVPVCEKQLLRITNNTKLIKYVTNMVLMHMRPNKLAMDKSCKKKTREMFDNSVCPEDLILLSKADDMGRKNAHYNKEQEIFLRDRLNDYYQTIKQPMITGQDLINAGLTPGPNFSEILKRGRKLIFAGLDHDKALKQIIHENKTT